MSATAAALRRGLALEDAFVLLTIDIPPLVTPSRFPATAMLRQLGDLPLGDPIRTAAMFEARARDSLAEAQWNGRASYARAAWVFRLQFEDDMERAREILAEAAAEEAADAA